MVLFNDAENSSRINVTTLFKQQILSFKSTITIKSKGHEEKTYEKLIMKTTLDSCNIQKGVLGNFLIKTIVENLRNYSNFEFVCPQPVGFFYCYNFPVSVFGENLPRSIEILIGSKALFEVIVDIKAKMKKAKPLVQIATWKMYGKFY